MKKITLTAADWKTPQDAHRALKEALSFPEYYGNNLDALYDVLTEIGQETEIILTEPAAVVRQMGKYGEALLATMQEAAENNPRLIVKLQ